MFITKMQNENHLNLIEDQFIRDIGYQQLLRYNAIPLFITALSRNIIIIFYIFHTLVQYKNVR